MTNEEARELLLLRLMHLIAEKYRESGVLKGGMVLRLLNSPRLTQDLDYVFATTESRKLISSELKELIEKSGDLLVKDVRLNSRGITMQVTQGGVLALLEVSIIDALNCPPEQMTTASLAGRYQMSARIITVMSLAESYANKIAACIERAATRDLYDLTIYQPLCTFDLGTLNGRLAHIEINRAKKKAITLQGAAQILRTRAENLDAKKLQEELRGLVPETFLQGGLMIIKSCVLRLSQELDAIE